MTSLILPYDQAMNRLIQNHAKNGSHRLRSPSCPIYKILLSQSPFLHQCKRIFEKQAQAH